MVKVSHWLFGDITIQLRKNPRAKVVIRKPVPWDRRNPNYKDELRARPALYAAIQTFKEVASKDNTGSIIWEHRREYRTKAIASSRRGVDFGGKKRTSGKQLSEAECKDLVVRLRRKVIEMGARERQVIA